MGIIRSKRDTMMTMRACAIANAIFAGLVLGGSAFVACAGGGAPAPEQTAPPKGSASTADKTDEADRVPVVASASSAAVLPASTVQALEADAATGTEAALDCKEHWSEIVNEPPDAGVVMNNAMTAVDAGANDRFRSILEALKENGDGFRCCFDLWGRDHPGASGRMAVVIDLDMNGILRAARIKPEESDVHSAEVEASVTKFSKTISFPPSPSGRETKYTHLFEFKSKR